MGAGQLAATALDYACEAGMLLAQYVPRGGDRIGLLLLGGDGSAYIPPGRGPLHTMRIREALSVASVGGTTPEFATVLRNLPSHLSQPTHVFAFAPIPEDLGPALAGLSTFRDAGHRLYFFPPDLAGMYPPFPEASRQAFLELAEASERRRLAGLRSGLERFGVPVHPYDRQGAGSRLLALYQQIHTWGMGR